MKEYTLTVKLRTDATPEEIERWLSTPGVEGRTMEFFNPCLTLGWVKEPFKAD